MVDRSGCIQLCAGCSEELSTLGQISWAMLFAGRVSVVMGGTLQGGRSVAQIATGGPTPPPTMTDISYV